MRPAPGYLDNALGEVAAEQHLTSIASPKTDVLISKVRPLFVRNNLEGLLLHEKSLKAIITDLLKKSINCEKIKKNEIRHFLGDEPEN